MRYNRHAGFLREIAPFYQDLQKQLESVESGLNDIIEGFRAIPEGSFSFQQQIYQELNAQFNRAVELRNNLEFLLAAEWDNYVYWFEIPARADSSDVRLYAAPLEIASILASKLYKKLRTAVFTSATLAVSRDFQYFMHRVGLDLVEPERVEAVLLDSPFNYMEQVLLLVPTFIADPRDPEYSVHIQDFIKKIIQHVPRGMLVLFTSYALLNNVYKAVRTSFQAQNILLLGQGIDGSRHSLINQFKAVKNSVLFGTDSFWEGVDVPGKALEILLITRLPFEVPSEPIVQAKAEMIRRQGGNPFLDYFIPEAVIRFRQGFGRLIRSKSDYGAIIILDTRVVKKQYGRRFLDSLPIPAREVPNEALFWQKLTEWFANY